MKCKEVKAYATTGYFTVNVESLVQWLVYVTI